MPLIVLLALLLIGNWLFSELLVFIPYNLLNSLDSLTWLGFIVLLCLFLSWCLGD